MARVEARFHVSTHRRHHVGKDAVARDCETHLLRRSYRQDGKVKNGTVANLSHPPAELIEMVRAPWHPVPGRSNARFMCLMRVSIAPVQNHCRQLGRSSLCH